MWKVGTARRQRDYAFAKAEAGAVKKPLALDCRIAQASPNFLIRSLGVTGDDGVLVQKSVGMQINLFSMRKFPLGLVG
jgi:hypothetical protein